MLNPNTTANKKLADLGNSVANCENLVSQGRISEQASFLKALGVLERSFWKLDASVRRPFESNLWSFNRDIIGRLMTLALHKKVTAHVSRHTGSLLLGTHSGDFQIEIRRNYEGGYVAFVPIPQYNGATLRRIVLASSILNTLYQIVKAIEEA